MKSNTEYYDVVIIGSGPAGLSIATTLSQNQNRRILIVETGNDEWNKEIQDLSFPEEVFGEHNQYYYSVHSHRKVGGGSNVWGGVTQVFDRKSFITEDWPINYSELYPYYTKAADFLNVSQKVHQNSNLKIINESNIVYKPFYLSRNSRIKNRINFIKSCDNVNLLTNYTCRKLKITDGEVSSLELINSITGIEYEKNISAKQFILSSGGIGNPRLLMNSNIPLSKLTGRGLSEHPHIYLESTLELKKSEIENYLETEDNAWHSIQLSDDYCADNNIESLAVEFYSDQIKENTLFLGRKDDFYWSKVNLRSEMPISNKNGIALINTKDRVGMKNFVAFFEFNYNEILQNQLDHMASELIRSKIGRLGTPQKNYKVNPAGHILCTTRMGKDIKDSTVDRNCKVHGVNNLFVAGSSVFPNAGAANPTLTIVALSIRLGEYIETRLI